MSLNDFDTDTSATIIRLLNRNYNAIRDNAQKVRITTAEISSVCEKLNKMVAKISEVSPDKVSEPSTTYSEAPPLLPQISFQLATIQESLTTKDRSVHSLNHYLVVK